MKKDKLPLIAIVFALFIYQTTFAQSLKNIFDSNWNKATFTSKVEAEFPIMNDYENIIIAEILDERDIESSNSRDVYDALADGIYELKSVKLLDRKKTQLLLDEFEFQEGGLVDEKFIKKLGEFRSSGVLLVGRIQRGGFTTQTIESPSLICKNSSFKIGMYNLSINFRLIDLSTTDIIYSKTLTAQGKTQTKDSCNKVPLVDEQEVYLKCLQKLRENFKNLFVDYERSFEIEFQKNNKFNDELKEAITRIKVGDSSLGYNKLKDIVNSANEQPKKNKKVISSALHNLAVYQLHTNRKEEAWKNAKEAYILNSKNEECLEIMELAKAEEE